MSYDRLNREPIASDNSVVADYGAGESGFNDSGNTAPTDFSGTVPTGATGATGATAGASPAPGGTRPGGAISGWAKTLEGSSHPVTLLVYIILRLLPPIFYIFGSFVLLFFISSNLFILHFILLILLISADFWNLKNIAGRLLVGLRWWNETVPIDQTGEFENVWVFESADPDRILNPVDSKIFWGLLYLQPAIWGALCLLSVLKLQFLYLLIDVVGGILAGVNAMAYTKCDKFGRVNEMAGGLGGWVLGRWNPFG
jgi:ABC-type multidrug transport system fused ATPase/permease subunit